MPLGGILAEAWREHETKPKIYQNYQGKRARYSATKEATPQISGWFKKVLKRVGLSSF
jgi:hypothetical protein